jgi:hypothetical protein
VEKWISRQCSLFVFLWLGDKTSCRANLAHCVKIPSGLEIAKILWTSCGQVVDKLWTKNFWKENSGLFVHNLSTTYCQCGQVFHKAVDKFFGLSTTCPQLIVNVDKFSTLIVENLYRCDILWGQCGKLSRITCA